MSEQAVRKENKMGTMSVHRLLVTTALPIMISMLVGALYNIVDSAFVAKISVEAFTALSLAYPYQNLMIAVGVGTGVGINALLSRSLGEKNFDMANAAATNGVFLGILSYVLFAVLAAAGARPFMEIQTSDPVIIEHGITYIRIIGIYSMGLMGQLIFEKLLQSTGKTGYILLTQGLGAVINIILDPIMIFGYFGLPKMGVAGAAYATVISQIIGAIVAVVLNHKKNHEIKIDFKKYRPKLSVIKEIYRVALPSIIMASIGSVMIFFMNKILIAFSTAATAALGVYFKVQSFVFMPVFGLTNALVPIVAYNFGAKDKHRITKTLKLCYVYAIGIMLAGFALFQFFPEVILGFFSPDAEMLRLGIPALKIISYNFVFAGFGIVSSSFYQSLGNGLLSMIMSIFRQIVIIIPVAKLLSLTGDVNMIWWSIPLAEGLACLLSAVFLMMIFRRRISPLPENPPNRVEEKEVLSM